MLWPICETNRNHTDLSKRIFIFTLVKSHNVDNFTKCNSVEHVPLSVHTYNAITYNEEIN